MSLPGNNEAATTVATIMVLVTRVCLPGLLRRVAEATTDTVALPMVATELLAVVMVLPALLPGSNRPRHLRLLVANPVTATVATQAIPLA